jgi:putative transposase
MEDREENLRLMRLLDEQYTRTPFYGTRKMSAWLHTQGYPVDRKRVRRLLRIMGLEAIYPKPRISVPGIVEQRYPYLLRGMSIGRCDQVWSCDITYIRLQRGFIYLMAVMDWFSRYVLSWEISITLDTSFCLEALDRALRISTPEIFNTDQGVQFTSVWVTHLVPRTRYGHRDPWQTRESDGRLAEEVIPVSARSDRHDHLILR